MILFDMPTPTMTTTQSMTPIATLTPPALALPPIGDYGGGGGSFDITMPRSMFSLKNVYQAGITAKVLDIRAVKAPKIITGIKVRPIVKTGKIL